MAHSGTRGVGQNMEVELGLLGANEQRPAPPSPACCLLREHRFVFCLCLFANFLASHVCLALRLYNAPINWVRQAARQPGKAATEARACFKCLINAPLCCLLTQLIHINALQPQATATASVLLHCAKLWQTVVLACGLQAAGRH